MIVDKFDSDMEMARCKMRHLQEDNARLRQTERQRDDRTGFEQLCQAIQILGVENDELKVVLAKLHARLSALEEAADNK